MKMLESSESSSSSDKSMQLHTSMSLVVLSQTVTPSIPRPVMILKTAFRFFMAPPGVNIVIALLRIHVECVCCRKIAIILEN